jgi:CBS domain-containing protein
MSTPPITLGPRERAKTIVKVLRETDHHGFPIVDPQTNKFLGLVRRDQLVALIEHNVFEDDDTMSDDVDSIDDSTHSGATASPLTRSRLMNLAYHINDDRYEFAEFDMRGSVSASTWAQRLAEASEDEFDTYAWLKAVRRSLASMPSINDKMRRPNSRTALCFGDDSLPPLTPYKNSSDDLRDDRTSSVPVDDIAKNSRPRGVGNTNEFATVATNRKGNVYIRWLDPLHQPKWVNIAAVMNRGTYTVTEFCPVSKAHFLFTALGLRHLIVLGGSSGGSVVGIITRINLLKCSLEDRTGYSIQ